MKPTRRSVLSSLAVSATAALAPRLLFGQNPPPPAEPSLHDPLRPSFHYLPARNWMNDPCAPVFHRGQYHLFHQYNPHSSVWGDMHWAHAVSPDMVHWQRLPIALAPTPGGPDSAGCFTGSALFQRNSPAIIYTGVQSVPHEQATISDGHNNFRETQLLATTTDIDLRSWTKRPVPVIPSPPPGMEVTGFRDPAPFQFAGHQYLLIGSGVFGKGGMVLLYRASQLPDGLFDLTRWEYLHPFAEGQRSTTKTSHDPVDTGEMWECPDFFELDGRHVLIYSTERITFWQVGDVDPQTLRFHPSTTGRLDEGRSFYAPKTQLDAHGNRILWGWLSETRPEAEFAAAGWSGMMSLPRILSVQNGELRMHPIPALRQLRGTASGREVNEFTANLQQTHTPAAAAPFLLSDSAGPLLAIQSSDSAGARAGVQTGTQAEALPAGVIRPHLPAGAAASLHVFFDNSVIELFLDGRICHTHRFYTRDPGKPVLTLLLPGRSVADPHSFALSPIWPSSP